MLYIMRGRGDGKVVWPRGPGGGEGKGGGGGAGGKGGGGCEASSSKGRIVRCHGLSIIDSLFHYL